MGPKSERVYRTIREWVATGRLKPGEKLPSP
ncbi:GntR family transcriptional regulator [Streptomyces sp. NPDC002867]